MFECIWTGKEEMLNTLNCIEDIDLELEVDNSIDIENTNNIFFKGDNLLILNHIRDIYKDKIKMIYIDPPYNTGSNFLYKDSFYNYNIKCKHSNYLNFIYPRLKLARELLKEDGVICISIDENEHHRIRNICDEIFGFKNFCGDVIRQTRTALNCIKNNFNVQHEYLIIYAKDKSKTYFKGEEKTFEDYSNPDNDPRGEWISSPVTQSKLGNNIYPITNPYTGKVDLPPIDTGRTWRFCKTTFDNYVETGQIVFKKEHKENERGFFVKKYKSDVSNFKTFNSLFSSNTDYINGVGTKEIIKLFGYKSFEFPKPVKFIKELARAITNKYDIVLDFFAGSGTTAQAIMELNKEDFGNRKFILIQQDEKINGKTVANKFFNSLTDIVIERIKLVGSKINFLNLDLGCKVYRIKEKEKEYI